MKAKQALALAFVLASLLMLFTACGGSSGGAPSASPDQLHLIKPAFANGVALDKTVTNQDIVQKLYNKAESLPQPQSNQICPEIAGPHYQLTFLQKGSVVLQATADRSGCGTLKLGNNDVRQTDDAFWSLLRQAEADK